MQPTLPLREFASIEPEALRLRGTAEPGAAARGEVAPDEAARGEAARDEAEAGWAERQWFAVGVAPRHEKAVSRLLDHKGYETFVPLYSRKHEYARRVREFELPLFPGYLFCRIDPAVRLPILITPGVLHFIGAGRVPIAIDESEIAALRAAVLAGIPMVPCPSWQSGQKGRILEGPLEGVEGIVVNAKNPLRMILSVSLLQRSVLLEIDSARVTSA